MNTNKIDFGIFKQYFQKHIYREANGIKSKRKKIIEDYKNNTSYEMTKGQYDHCVKKLSEEDKQSMWEESRGDLPTRDINEFGVDKTTNEGLYYSQRYIEVSAEAKLSDEEIMMLHGYDPELWEVVESKSTGSKIGTKGNEEQYFINTYKSIRVRPRDITKLTSKEMSKLLSLNAEPLKALSYETRETPKAFETDFFDIHVNSTGYSRDVVIQKVLKMKEYISNNDIGKVYLIFGGDFLHVNDTNEKTVKGTQLKLVGSAYDMIREGEWLARFIIETLAIVETDVFWVLGNHSDLPEYQLFDKLAHIYSESEHITFHNDESPYKAFVYGNQFVMVSHGNINIKELQHLCSQRFPKLWAQAKYWEVHLGHIHHEVVKSFGSLIVRYQRTPKETDNYEYYNGWYNDLTHIQAYTIDKENGIESIHYY